MIRAFGPPSAMQQQQARAPSISQRAGAGGGALPAVRPRHRCGSSPRRTAPMASASASALLPRLPCRLGGRRSVLAGRRPSSSSPAAAAAAAAAASGGPSPSDGAGGASAAAGSSSGGGPGAGGQEEGRSGSAQQRRREAAMARSATAFWSQPDRQPASLFGGPAGASQGNALGLGGSAPPEGPEPFSGYELQGLIRSIPFKKIALWSFVFVAAYQLKEFFGIAMGTFIIAFIGNSFVVSAADAVLWLAPDNPPLRRRALVVAYFCLIVAFVTLFGVLTIPDIAREGADFVGRLKSDNVWVILVEKTRQGLGDQIMESAERFVYLATSSDITRAAADVSKAAANADWSPERSVQLGLAVSSMLKGYTTTAAAVVSSALRSVTKFAIQVGVSLVLGFFLLWDLPAITAGVRSLQRSRLAPVYAEVAPVLSVFGRLFGKALEAQSRIAAVNTALTAVGLWSLAIPGVGLLSLFCFVCSFIPIAGVIISTTPIGFVALTEYGFTKLALVILMVTAVHFVEAYMLNPAIYSAHLKLHPLLVLSALVVAEHNAGVWGLLLAVPMTVFALDYLIRYPQSSVTEVGEKELEKVMRTDEDEATMMAVGLEEEDAEKDSEGEQQGREAGGAEDGEGRRQQQQQQGGAAAA